MHILLSTMKNSRTTLNSLRISKGRSPRDDISPLGLHFFYPTLSNGITWHRLFFGCSGSSGRSRFHEAADLLRRASLHIIGDVRIGVPGKPGAEVAQHTGQGLHIHAAGEGHRGERMTQIVGTHKLFNARLC